MTNNLAPYEQRLLTELRGVVAEQAATAPAAVRARTSRPRRRLVIGFGAAAALAVAGAVGAPVLLGAGDRPAYAAEREPDGSIRILIREYTDAKGLQARLRQLGVAAVVDHVPYGKHCREPRATYVPDDKMPSELLTHLPPEDGEERYLKLRPELIGAGQTFVFTTTIVGDLNDDDWGTVPQAGPPHIMVVGDLEDDGQGAVAQIGLATGPVGPCELVPGPVLVRKGG
jgi:hypothetical protein